MLISSLQVVISYGQILSQPKVVSGYSYEYVKTHVRDSKGNTYVSFFTYGSTTNNPVTIFNVKVDNISGGYYVAKLDPNGELVWYKNYGTILAMTVDSNDNLIVTGNFSQYIFLISKISPDGSVLWQVKEGTNGGIYGTDLIVDQVGNIYVTGTANSWNLFGLTMHVDGCCLDHDFIIKFSASGSLLWIRASAPDSLTNGIGLSFDQQGNILVVGQYVFTMNMGSFSLPLNFGYTGSYLATLSPQGNVISLQGFGSSTGHCTITDVAVDNNGSIYLTGAFYGTITFGNQALTSSGNYDVYIAKLSPSKNVEWLKKTGSPGVDRADYLAIVSDGILVSGVAAGSLSLDDKTVNNPLGTKAFVARITKEGFVKWFTTFGNVTPSDGSTLSERSGYELRILNEHCFTVSGHFTNVLESNEGQTKAIEADALLGFLSDAITVPLNAGPDVSIDLCGEDRVVVPLVSTNASIQTWTVVKGSVPTIANSTLEAIISNIGVGETVLKWTLRECEVYDEKIITIHREIRPSPPSVSGAKICSVDLGNTQIAANGTLITWYQDSQLQQKLQEGKIFIPTTSSTLYVTNTVNYCESLPVSINIHVTETPLPPLVRSYEACANSVITLSADGKDLSWYGSAESTTPLFKGQHFKIDNVLLGEALFYVTQTIDGCESDKQLIIITGHSFSTTDFVLSNVITMNEDGVNDSFFIPEFKTEMCLGEFEGIVIYNRWGQRVFQSTERTFKWKPENLSLGTYFYELKFSFKEFKSWISLIR